VPRATGISNINGNAGVKVTKDNSQSPIDQSYNQQFLHNNNLKSFMWNKGSIGTD